MKVKLYVVNDIYLFVLIMSLSMLAGADGGPRSRVSARVARPLVSELKQPYARARILVTIYILTNIVLYRAHALNNNVI